MFKFIAVFALAAVASAAPGFVSESHHSFVQPAVLTKTAVVDTSASSAITHQSFTNLEKKVPVVHSYAAAPVVKTVSYETAPVVKSVSYSAPVVKTVAPVVHTYESAPVVKSVSYSAPAIHTYESAPVVKSVSYAAAPVVKSVHTYESAPVVKTVSYSAPVVKTFVSSPVTYTKLHH
ncbi:cuticle protein-like [Lucilia sericata]|uniref:cuticle protein-like n=1 Tax=Lucilia sericata TaxID=13632 RepID=UPI0018A7EAD3|nr:cuticle protein-like [Lucilia sericata]